MQSRVSRSLHYFVLPCLALCLALITQAVAKDGRDFAGFYALSNVTEAGDKVALTLTVQLFNNSDLGAIKQPVVALLESGSHSLMGKFSAVKQLPAKHDVIVSGQFTVSRHEFQNWSRHGSPQVVVMYSASGRTLRQSVQLSRRPTLPPPAAN